MRESSVFMGRSSMHYPINSVMQGTYSHRLYRYCVCDGMLQTQSCFSILVKHQTGIPISRGLCEAHLHQAYRP